ncbi:transmembrane protein, putative (macronuclear) [Tetrahymena thermophila SB210]|uniref:Transmembrane protein, putative n=1 Tax=Tetrahymena thermophila (strain SB210) TaxID=312017 RepID=W7XJH4_TETTS|nr:transmembrane protein, putative [Tetrahymena thermophila SB210]EWS74164.1 transmembrane protein, putative [Tetrahymena thermophila SB210]|eukprot:XP_012653304.1 transmembrane protein, putative [Tetrahymena thermophila SB210]
MRLKAQFVQNQEQSQMNVVRSLTSNNRIRNQSIIQCLNFLVLQMIIINLIIYSIQILLGLNQKQKKLSKTVEKQTKKRLPKKFQIQKMPIKQTRSIEKGQVYLKNIGWKMVKDMQIYSFDWVKNLFQDYQQYNFQHPFQLQQKKMIMNFFQLKQKNQNLQLAINFLLQQSNLIVYWF